jgi:hypothetical protein
MVTFLLIRVKQELFSKLIHLISIHAFCPIINNSEYSMSDFPQCQFNQHFTHSFYTHIPKAQNIVKLLVFFALSGYAHVKAACKMMMKLTPGHNETILV